MNENIVLLDIKKEKYQCFWYIETKKVDNIVRNVTKYNDKYNNDRYMITFGTTCQDIRNSSQYKHWENDQTLHDGLVIEYNSDLSKKYDMTTTIGLAKYNAEKLEFCV